MKVERFAQEVPGLQIEACCSCYAEYWSFLKDSFFFNFHIFPTRPCFDLQPLNFNCVGMVPTFSLKEMTSNESPRISVSAFISTSGDQMSYSAADTGVLGRRRRDFLSFFFFFCTVPNKGIMLAS